MYCEEIACSLGVDNTALCLGSVTPVVVGIINNGFGFVLQIAQNLNAFSMSKLRAIVVHGGVSHFPRFSVGYNESLKSH